MISFALIAKNEEKDIARCLDSIKDLASEIVVVDTGSTDRTKEIAKQYTKKVFDFKWIDDFSAARNFSFSKCTCEWIFWIDCDDIIKPEDAKKILALDYSDKEIIFCKYQYSHDEYDNVSSSFYRERIVKRSLNLKWERPIHETMPTLHSIYISDIEVHHYKKGGTSERNLEILKRIVKKEKSQDSRNVYYLGKEYFDFGKIEAAVKYLKKFLTKKDGWWEDKYAAYYMLAMASLQKGYDKKFKEYMYKSIDIEERRAEPYFQLGLYYSSREQWEKAIHWYKLCLAVDRPSGLWGAYQPEYYTWLPCLQLCLCYNSIGDMKKAYEYNKKVLEYRPQDSVALNNEQLLSMALNVKKDGEGKKLNLGCGGKAMAGYVNVDIFEGEKVDEIFNLDDIPYSDNTISAINSEHSLEHVGWERSNKALHEWYRVLKPGSELLLKMPDLEQCCRKYIETSVENKTYKDWYKYTICGIQKSQGGEPDEAQTHISGYSKQELENLLTSIGFIIDYCENYDGWDTPSVGLRAVKPVSSLKIGWITAVNWEAAQTRIRILNLDRLFRSKGYYSKIVNYPNIVNENFDVAIIGKAFDEHHYKNIKMLKQYGKTVFCDLCEDILDFAWVKEILAICDKVICCSYKLEEKVKEVNCNTIVIEDAYEV